MPLLSGCSFFRSSEKEAISIKEILVDYDPNGNAIITISYTDKNREPVSFTLNKGKDGQVGNGIQKVEYDVDDYGITTVTMSFTDKDMKPVSFELAPGKSIVDVKFDTDDEGNTKIIFIDNEGEELPAITVFKGDTGVGIASIISSLQEDGTTILTIIMDDGTFDPDDPDNLEKDTRTRYDITIPAPKDGENGRGIKTIEAIQQNGKYMLIVTYTDDTTEEPLIFDAPAGWSSGTLQPGQSEGGNGDYFFDTAHGIIYHKENGVWKTVVDFNTENKEFVVSFNLNDSDNNYKAHMPTGYDTQYLIKKNETFISSTQKEIPIPTRYKQEQEYTFLGWARTPSPNVTNGFFTDMTPVTCDLTLYAIWAEPTD